MTTGRLLLCFALAVAACEREPKPTEPAAEETTEAELPALALPEHLERDVDAYVAQWGRGWPTFRFHGEIAISVRGEVKLQRAYGFRDLAEQQPHEIGTPFRVGTLSAHVTAATVLALANDGVLRLEDRVDRWIPELRIADVLTIEHLLTHTSGLPSFTEDLAYDHIKHLARTHDELARGFASDPLEFEPGSDFAPSNSNSALLGLVIERATKQTYADAVKARVLQPLAMTETNWGSARGEARGLVFDEEEHLEPPDEVDPRALGGAGGWITTTRDLHRLYAGLWGERFGGDLARLRMFGANPFERPYAFVESSIDGRTAYVWLGLIDGFNSATLVVPEDELVITVLGNSEVVPAQQVVGDVLRLVYDMPVTEREEPRAMPMATEERERVTGDWIVTVAAEDLLLENVDPETYDAMKRIRVASGPGGVVLTVPGYGFKRMHLRSPGRFFFVDGPQSTARLERGTAPERDVLVLERDATSLRYVRAPQAVAARQ